MLVFFKLYIVFEKTGKTFTKHTFTFSSFLSLKAIVIYLKLGLIVTFIIFESVYIKSLLEYKKIFEKIEKQRRKI